MQYCEICQKDVETYSELLEDLSSVSRCLNCQNIFSVSPLHPIHSPKEHEDVALVSPSCVLSATGESVPLDPFLKPGSLEKAIRKRLSDITKQIKMIGALEQEKRRLKAMLEASKCARSKRTPAASSNTISIQ